MNFSDAQKQTLDGALKTWGVAFTAATQMNENKINK